MTSSAHHRVFRITTHCEKCERDISAVVDSKFSVDGEWINCSTCETPRFARMETREEVERDKVFL